MKPQPLIWVTGYVCYLFSRGGISSYSMSEEILDFITYSLCYIKISYLIPYNLNLNFFIITMTSYQQWVCPHCKEVLKQRQSAPKHLKTKHPNEYENAKKEKFE